MLQKNKLLISHVTPTSRASHLRWLKFSSIQTEFLSPVA